MLFKYAYKLDNWSRFKSESGLKTVTKLKHSMKVIIQKMRMKMKKFLVLASIILLLSFVTTSLFSIAFNINLKRDAHAVENIFYSVSVGLLFEKYLPQETYYNGSQNNPSPLKEPFKMLLLGVGFIFVSLIGRKMFKS